MRHFLASLFFSLVVAGVLGLIVLQLECYRDKIIAALGFRRDRRR